MRSCSIDVAVLIAGSAAVFTAPPAPAQVSTDWAEVGNPGNAPDPTTGFGSVGYKYQIGGTEVTNAQYAEFLNAVAPSDPNALYSPLMGEDTRGGIARSGEDGAYVYSVRQDMGNKPVTFVSWYDAARFCNWLSNGQGSGGTETGAYALDGVSSIGAITRDLSDPDQVFLPTEDEWYKAAFHQPESEGGDGDGYWLYATQSNSTPTVASATASGDIANPGPGVVNYFSGADWNGADGNVTTVGSAGPQSATFYGVFDMNGNVWEWNEALIDQDRGIRGASWSSFQSGLGSDGRNAAPPESEAPGVGFRVASPAPPCSNADFAAPLGALDFNDVVAFLSAFSNSDPTADLDDPIGSFDFNDVVAFLTLFAAGCP